MYGSGGAVGQNIFSQPINHFILTASMAILIFLTIVVEKALHKGKHMLKGHTEKMCEYRLSSGRWSWLWWVAFPSPRAEGFQSASASDSLAADHCHTMSLPRSSCASVLPPPSQSSWKR